MASSQARKFKVEELESVRGIAALLVVLYHLPNWNPFIHHLPIIHGAGFMVDLFFVLSGFVIFTAYQNKLKSWSDVARFQFLRFGRLYPVHLLMLVIYLMIETLKYVLQTKFGIASLSKPPFEENNFYAFLREFFLVKAFWPNETAMTFNSPAWSISAEFYTYLIFAVITLYLNKIKTFVFPLISLICISALFLYQPEHYNFMLRCLAGFFTGCTVAYFILKHGHADGALLPVFTIPLSIVLILSVTILASGFYGYGLIIYPASALLIAGILLTPDNIFKRYLSKTWLIWLGTVSYSLYMSHGAVLWFYNQVIRVAFHHPEVVIRGISTPQFTTGQSILLSIIYLMICFTLAQLMYSYIEKPFREKSRRFLNIKN
ncbi:MAG TPA: acyltransferase [Methylophilus sp.]|nr:acyltransferase [Methylophilus sp.]